MTNKYSIYDEKIINLAKEGKRPCDIAKIINIDSRRVIERLKLNKINYIKGNSNKKIEAKNEVQYQVLIGTILGDGCLFKGNGNINYRMNLAHGLKQKEYFMYKYNILRDLGFDEPKIQSELHSKNNKTYYCIKTQSKTNPLFTELHNIFYKNGKKIIPKSQIKKIKDLAIAIMFLDDGYNTKSGYGIAMNNFDNQSINYFRIKLLEEYGIETSIHSNNNLYIRANSKEKFKKIVVKYATQDVLYKLG